MVIFRLIYYAASFSISSCLESVPLEVVLRSWVSRTIIHAYLTAYVLSKTSIFRQCGFHNYIFPIIISFPMHMLHSIDNKIACRCRQIIKTKRYINIIVLCKLLKCIM